jgi:CheY-like chemotaxis protein
MPARILIIEDNPANMELMVCLLTAFGHQALLALDGEAGIVMAREAVPDLIVCDVHLPKLDGFGVLRYLKSHPVLAAIPTIAVTALAMVGDRERLLAAGFNGYISKPIEPVHFIGQLEQFLPLALHSVRSPFATTSNATNESAHGDHSDR